MGELLSRYYFYLLFSTYMCIVDVVCSDVLSSLSSKQPSTVDEFVGDTNLNDIDLFVIFKTSKVRFN